MINLFFITTVSFLLFSVVGFHDVELSCCGSNKTKKKKSSSGDKNKDREESASISTSENEHAEQSIAFLVNTTLKMGKGKAMAQVCHAAIRMNYRSTAIIVLKADQNQISTIRTKARNSNVPTFSIYDAGRTQVPPNSNTVLSLGPAPKEIIAELTKELKLY